MIDKKISYKKKILINCINSHNYGGYAYWSGFVKSFKKNLLKTNNEYYFIINENSKIFKKISLKKSIIVKNYIHENFLLRFLYEQIYIPIFIFKKYKFDIYFNAKNIAPILIRKKSIIAIRNIEPFFYDTQKTSLNKLISFLKFIFTIFSMRDCYKIISVSNNTKTIIKKYTKKKIFVIPNGVSVLSKYQNKWSRNNTKNYILHASKFVPYANQLKFLKIYKKAIIKNKDLPPLYFVGDIYDKIYFKKVCNFIQKNNLKNKIKFLGYLSKNKLHLKMTECKIFIFSSELESCPQTILEARTIGCPILSTNIEPMPEFLENDASYFNLNNINKSSDLLISLIIRINKRKTLKNNFHMNRYNWRNIILKYFKVFEDF